ncbi:undecaprenyl diphosphate synthase family protein [Oscillospiraceae bacterium PP1C4]
MRVPAHIGIIPDGNRRWASNQGFQKQDGYRYGLDPGLALLKLASSNGIQEVTYYGFTTDNCKRPHAQIEAFSSACIGAVNLIATESVSLLVVGNTDSPLFPEPLLKYTKRTDINGGGTKVNFLVNYGWEWDLSYIGNQTNRKSITEALKTKDISRMDLIIRWGGMRRLSGFLPIQSVYADFYVINDMWPDFKPQHFYEALDWYNKQDITLGG